MLSDLLKPSALFALPRAGLDPDTEQLLREFDQVVYISCNPETLAKNLNAVADTHDIARFAVFDQVRAAGSKAGRT
jgi:tRNA (uracil-5-)-methyltransferase